MSQSNMTRQEATLQWENYLKTLTPEARAELEAQQRKTQARPKITILTPDLLRSFPVEHLDTALIEYINGKLSPYHYTRSELQQLPRGLQVFYLSFIVEAEVMNGGLNQFFWNSSSEYAELVSPALRDLEATAAADLFEQAFSVAKHDAPRIAEFKSIRTPQAFSDSYKNNPLNELDEPFSKLASDFSRLRLRYTQRHVENFF